MKKFFKILSLIILVLALGISGILGYIKLFLPNIGPAQDITINADSALIERGDYLANHVMVCMDCHSSRDWSSFSGPLIESTKGKGGEVFDQKLGFLGKYIAPNLTPYNLKDWTDGELLRAISTGVAKDGRALFPVMPHHNFGKSDENDLKAVIAYLRTLPSIENKTEASVSDFPMNFIINTIPEKATFNPIPSKEDKVAYGKYLITAASCYDCHTKQEQGKFVGEPYAGGMEFQFPDGTILKSKNITPHENGIKGWTSEQFVARFKMYDKGYQAPKVDLKNQTVMPWSMYAGMTEEDLSAIFSYLQTVEPKE